MSTDGLSAGQANKFAKKLGLKNLRIQGGFWVAEDGEGGDLYTITFDNYWAAWHEGDLA